MCVYKLPCVEENGREAMYTTMPLAAGHKRTILKKDRGNKSGLQNVDGNDRGGNLMTRRNKAALERGREGTI